MAYLFQSTYLYKVRQEIADYRDTAVEFQSTYLYKVRLRKQDTSLSPLSFNPRTYIRYDEFEDIAPLMETA